jgi:RNA polymerase sigma factor for flagellar operon FliA
MATQIAVPQATVPGIRLGSTRPFPLWDRGIPLPQSAPPSASVARRRNGGASLQGAEAGRLVVALLPLVRGVALQLRERLPLHVEVDDLVSTGVLGLVDAIQKFDARKRVKLERYARHRIRGAILDGLRGLDSASRDMRKKNKRAERVYRALEANFKRPPTDVEMAEGLGISLAGWYRTVRELRFVGIDWLRPMGSVGIKEARAVSEDTLPGDNEGHQFEACYRREQKEILHRALARIPERERRVVQLYYQRELTMRQIGKRMGIDESRVSQLHSAALVRLRKRVKDFLQNPAPALPRMAW